MIEDAKIKTEIEDEDAVDSLSVDPYETFPVRRLRGRRVTYLVGAALLTLGILIWQYMPFAMLRDPALIEPWFNEILGTPYTPLLIMGIYILAGLTGIPMSLIVAATGMMFGPFYGLLYAFWGSLLSATLLFSIGHYLGKTRLRRYLGSRIENLSEQMGTRGLLAMLLLHWTPIAPFTVINLVAGYSHIRFKTFLIGTLLGMAPSVIALTAVGDQMKRLILDPDLFNILMLIIVIGALYGLIYLFRHALGRRRRAAEDVNFSGN